MFELFAIDASIRPGGFPIEADCVLDETSMLLFDTAWVHDGFYATPSDENIVMRWAAPEASRRTLILERLPLVIAVGLSDGIESYFEHLAFTRFELGESGRAVSIATVRFGEAGYGHFGLDVVRQSNVTLAALEAVGVGAVRH